MKTISTHISSKIRIHTLLKPLISTFKITKNKPVFYSNSLSKKDFSEGVRDVKTSYDGVLFTDHTKHLTEIHLNQPKKLNSLDLKMIRAILRKVRQWVPYNIDGFSSDSSEPNDQKKKPKVILFTSNGKAFCAGGDIVDLYKAKVEKSNEKAMKDFFKYEYILDYSLTKMEPIQICFWQGAVMGGGVGISINSPFRIACKSTSFAMPESKIGFFTDVGASYYLSRLINNSTEVGLYLGLTADRVSGKDLVTSGIATHYVEDPEKFEKLKEILISKVNENTDKEKIRDIIGNNTDITFNPNKFSFPNYDRIKYAFQLDSLDQIYKRLEKLSTGDVTSVEPGKDNAASIKSNETLKELITQDESSKKWAQDCINTLNKMSPLSMTVIIELLKRGQKMSSIEEAFNLESQLVSGFIESSDFMEGIRALLVEKDNKPIWKHKSYKEVNNKEVINKYFDRKEEIDVEHNL